MGRHAKPWYRKFNETWYVELGGVQHALAKGKRNQKEALQTFHKLLNETKRSVPVLTLRKLMEAFLDDVEREREPLTLEWYNRHLRAFVKFLGDDVAATDVLPKHVTAWLASKPDWQRSTRDGAIRAVKRLFKWAKKQRLLELNELEDMEKPGVQPRLKIISADQAVAIVAAIPDREFKEFLTFLGLTGCRPSEAMRLEAGMIHFSERVAVFPGKTTWRTKRERVVYLPEAAIPLLLDLCDRHPEGPLFRNTAGTPWTRHTIAHRFGRLRDRMKREQNLDWGAEATASAFRHRHVTDLLLAGIPIATVAEIAGHTSTAMISRHYSKLHEHHDHILSAVNRLSAPGTRPETVPPRNAAAASRPTAPRTSGPDAASGSEDSPTAPPEPARGTAPGKRRRPPR